MGLYLKLYFCFYFVIVLALFLEIVTASAQSNITDYEKGVINEFRVKVKDLIKNDKHMQTDHYLIRWLRDQNMDINRADEKFKKYMAYRRDKKIDTIVKEDFSDMRRWCNFTVDGHDKDGRPILIFPFGSCNLRRVSLAGKFERAVRYLEYLIETTAVEARKSKNDKGEPLAEAVGIMDLNGFTIKTHACLACLPFYYELINLLENGYPQSLKSFYFINTPRVFLGILEQVQAVIPPATKRVFKVFGHDKNEWSREFLKTIPKDQLIPLYGGTKNVGEKNKINEPIF